MSPGPGARNEVGQFGRVARADVLDLLHAVELARVNDIDNGPAINRPPWWTTDPAPMSDWPRSPVTGRVVLGAAIGRTTFEETVERADIRLTELRDLRQRLGSMLVRHLDRLAWGGPVEPIAADLVRDVEAFAKRFARRVEGTHHAAE
jgi:hypothetical protein